MAAGSTPRIEPHALDRPPPEPPLVRDQLVGLEGLVRRDAQGLERHPNLRSRAVKGSRFTATRTAFAPSELRLP